MAYGYGDTTVDSSGLKKVHAFCCEVVDFLVEAVEGTSRSSRAKASARREVVQEQLSIALGAKFTIGVFAVIVYQINGFHCFDRTASN